MDWRLRRRVWPGPSLGLGDSAVSSVSAGLRGAPAAAARPAVAGSRVLLWLILALLALLAVIGALSHG